MNELYEYIIRDAKITEQAKRFISMMKNLPETLAENLYRRLKVIQPNLRFVNWPNYPNSCVFEFNINGVNSQI